MVFPSDAVQINGALTTYDDQGDSGRYVHRRFCPRCGSSVAATIDAMPGVTAVLAGTLDDPANFQPTMEIFCASAQPWVKQPADVRKQFDGMPG